MKRIAIVLICILAVTGSAQMSIAMQHESVQKELLKNIQGLWKAWQDKNPEPFKQVLSKDGISVTVQGRSALLDVLTQMKDCEVKSYSIDEKGSRLAQIDANTFLITYTAEQDAVCAGTKVPSTVTVSEIWSNKDGKWKGLFYQETPLSK